MLLPPLCPRPPAARLGVMGARGGDRAILTFVRDGDDGELDYLTHYFDTRYYCFDKN